MLHLEDLKASKLWNPPKARDCVGLDMDGFSMGFYRGFGKIHHSPSSLPQVAKWLEVEIFDPPKAGGEGTLQGDGKEDGGEGVVDFWENGFQSFCQENF